jgi:hypothetical protein
MYDFNAIANHPASERSIPLYSGPITLNHAGGRCECACVMAFSWFPAPRCTLSIQTAAACPLRPGVTDFMLHGAALSVCITCVQLRTGQPTVARGIVSKPCASVGVSAVQAIEFLVPNLEVYLDVDGLGGNAQQGRHEWTAGGWTLRLEPLPSLEGAVDSAEPAGYAFTHRGVLTRTDRQAFDVRQAAYPLESARLALTFIRGAFTPVMFPTGRDAAGRPASWQVGPWIVDGGKTAQSWADRNHPSEFGKIWAGLLRASADDTLMRTVRNCMHCYVESNLNRGHSLEHCIVLSQIALEMLCWYHLVVKKRVRKAEYDGGSAANNLQRLLLQCRIPDAIPSGFRELPNVASSLTAAVVTVRNSIVHPRPRRKVLERDQSSLLREACHGAVWALELVLLWTFGYMGKYRDRRTAFWVGDVEEVPWK